MSDLSGAILTQNYAQGWGQTRQTVCISTHGDAGAKPRARLRASSTDVVAHSRILAAGCVQVSHWPWTVSTRETSGPWRVGACIQTQRGAEQLRNTQQRPVWFLRDTSKAGEHITGFICLSRRTFSFGHITGYWHLLLIKLHVQFHDKMVQGLGLNDPN